MTGPRPLHRLFGLSWSDLFEGTDVSVELEVDLSRRPQFLDVVLIRKGSGPIPRPLPDGFEDLAPHNLLTFKSHQETLDGWALAELIGHGVNYRKQAGPSQQTPLPEADVRLYAVCVRFPQNLEEAELLRPVQDGVYEIVIPTVATIRLVVVNRLPHAEHNAMLHLFSARREALQFARQRYSARSTTTSTLLLTLFRAYREDPTMSTQLQEFIRESIDDFLKGLPPEKRLEGLSPEELRKHLSPEERLEGLPPDELRKHLSPEERLEGLTPEKRLEGLTLSERLKGLSPAERRAALEELQREIEKERAPGAN